MIKKNCLTVFLLLTALPNLQAQRMIPKKKGLEINYGLLSNAKIGNDYFLNLGLTVNGRNGNYQLWAFEYAHQYYSYRDIQIPHETYTVEGGYSFFLLGDTYKNITLNLALTATIGYENINRGEQFLYDGARILNEENFIYGAGTRLSFETYLTDHLVFILQGKTKVFLGTDLEQFRPSVGLGIRFNF